MTPRSARALDDQRAGGSASRLPSGAIFTLPDPTLTIERSVLVDNEAANTGGAIQTRLRARIVDP